MEHFQHEKAIVSPVAQIGKDTRIWAFSNVADGAVIGQGCNICDGCFIEGGSEIGHRVTLKNNVAIFEGITLENDVFVGANTSFINDRYPRSNRQDEWTLEKTTVKRGATIGAGSVILCGITIGEYAVIGAGSVVTKDVQDHAIVVGNPADLIGFACECGRNLGDNVHCSCGKEYEMRDGHLVKVKDPSGE